MIDSTENKTETTSSKIARMKAQKAEGAEQRVEEFKAKAPERKRKTLIMIAVIIGVIFLGFSFFNYASMQSARVFLLNGTNEDLTIKIADKDYIVEAQSYEAITIPEGDYTYTSSLDDYSRKVEFSNTRTTWERFDNKSFIALNPGARALVWVEDIIAAEDGYEISNEEYEALEMKYLWGEVIEYDKAINYPFTEIPQEISGDEYSKTTIVTAADLVFTRGSYDALEYMYYESPANLNGFLKQSLLQFENDPVSIIYAQSLIMYYQGTGRYAALEDFAEQLITENPSVSSHISYQEIMSFIYGEESLLSTYEELLATDSDNPDYLYLLGRLQYKLTGDNSNIKKAIEIDPSHLLGNIAITYNSLEDGKTGELAQYLSVMENSIEDYDVLSMHLANFYQATNELGKYDNLLDQLLEESPLDSYLLSDKVIPLSANPDKTGLESYLSSLEQRLAIYPIETANYYEAIVETRAGILSRQDSYISAKLVDPIYLTEWTFNRDYSLNYLLINGELLRANNLVTELELNPSLDNSLKLLLLNNRANNSKEVQIYTDVILSYYIDDNSHTTELITNVLNGEQISLNEMNQISMRIGYKALLARYIYESGQGKQEFLNYSNQMNFVNDEIKIFLENL